MNFAYHFLEVARVCDSSGIKKYIDRLYVRNSLGIFELDTPYTTGKGGPKWEDNSCLGFYFLGIQSRNFH